MQRLWDPGETTVSAYEKHKSDFQTPLDVAAYMCSLIPKGAKTVLEPTPGVGNILRFLDQYHVTAPEDYFLLDDQRFDCVVMNPPFSAKFTNIVNCKGDYSKAGMRLGYLILRECMEKSDHVIALMPWFTIVDSDVRTKYLQRYGLRSITNLPRKTFGYTRIQTMILELDRGYTGETAFRSFDAKDDSQKLKLFADEESVY